MAADAERGATSESGSRLSRDGHGDARWKHLFTSALELCRRADDFDGAVATALALIADYTRLPLGHAVVFDTADGVLRSTGVWHADDMARFQQFVIASNDMQLTPGQGLPGRVVASGRPAWIADVAQDHNFPRAAAAAASGIHTAVAVPIVGSSGVIGALELFSDTRRECDDTMVDLLEQVGSLLGATADRLRESAERQHAEDQLRRSERGLAEAQRLAHIGSWSWDVGADQIEWSAELHRIYGLDDAAGPVSFDDYIVRVHADDREMVVDAVRQALETLRPYEHDYRIVWPTGAVRWVHAAGQVAEQVDGRAIRLGGFCHDITEQREADERRHAAQEALASHRQILERVVRGEPLPATLDALCREVEARCPGALCSILMVSPGGEGRLRHAAAPSLPDAFRTAIDGLPIDDNAGACGRAAFRGQDVVVVDTLTDTLTSEFVELAENHQLRAVWSHPLTTPGGELLGTFAVYRKEPSRPDDGERDAVVAAGSIAAVAIERTMAERALTTAARRDPLTGLANRATFLNELRYRVRRPGRRTAVLFCDLDRFKWINDSIGHTAGDRVLVDVAWRLEQALDGLHLLARFGGDEFTVLVDDATGPDLETIADQLTAAVEAPFVLDGGEFYLSLSIGIATTDAAADAVDLVRDADAAMYAAKERGRGRHAVFDSALRERAVARVTTEAELRRGIQRDEIVMHYQPIVDLHSIAWVGVESLARWHHPMRGVVLPDGFVPLAEETGLINPLGQQIITRVLSDAVALAGDEQLEIGVNVSALQLTDPNFADELEGLLTAYGFDPKRLVVEVTETAVMQQIDLARAAVEELALLGARVFIDDFGTGYSSIERLRELPVTGVKIDRSFSARLGVSDSADRLVGAITDLAHAMELHVVVEGIETAEAAARAEELGCEFGQGYHFARPAPVTDLRVPS